MTYQPKTAYIVSHTHWDREWYLTFHTFRVDLVRLVKKVLDVLESDDEFKHFLLDGQSVILEDYFEIHPDDEDRIRRLVENGSLSLGPWYMLPDEFLISAESHVRNLLYGHKIAKNYGGTQKVGYMPDSFGHIAQMPQILSQAGIDSFIYTRGNAAEADETGLEYFWQAPDGSEILAVNQCGGYCNATSLGYEELWHAHTRREIITDRAINQVRELFEKMKDRTNGDIALLNNGCDHVPPQKEFGRIIQAVREDFPETEFKHTGLREFIDAVRQAGFVKKRFMGEMASGRLHPILTGVWSARMYLKQKNDEAQTLLANYFEPISSYTYFMNGREYPSGLIEYAWKLLLKNHPHDSICGCSIDEVHREMIPRFDGVIETSEKSISNQMENIAPTFARTPDGDRETVLCVFNPLPKRRTEVVERLVVLQPFGIDPENLHLIDGKGREIPFRIIKKLYVERFWGIDYRTMLDTGKQLEKFQRYLDSFGPRIIKSEDEKDEADCFFLIQFVAEDLPPVGYVNYRLSEKPGEEYREIEMDGVTVEGNEIENKFCKVVAHPNGSFDLHDKESGKWYREQNLLESTEDVGDEYDFSPCENSTTISTDDLQGELEILEEGGSTGSIGVRYDLNLPEKISEDRKSRVKENTACPVEIKISLKENSPVVDIDVRFVNNVEDHRLRAIFPSGIRTESVISDGHYFSNERPIEKPDGEGWRQPPADTYPQQDFSLMEDGVAGLAVLNQGLPEIEAMKMPDGTGGLALTLLRSVGWLSRDDFPTRNYMNAGPTIATPDAQCPGEHRFRYAVMPYKGSWVDAGIKHISQRWRTPVLMVQGVEDLSIDGGVGLVESEGERTCITAIKKHEDRDTLVVRLYNLTREKVRETVKFGREVKNAWCVNLLEERIDGELEVMVEV